MVWQVTKKNNRKVSSKKEIKILADIEAKAIVFAQECSKARRLLEKSEGFSPASRKGKILAKETELRLVGTRRKNLARSKSA
jgi:hypothetical protein